MLQPHEIFARMPEPVSEQLLGYLFEKEKPLYKATIDTLTKQRKLRPVFVERKPRTERHAWMRDVLGKKANESVAAHLLQIWLVGAHAKLLCDFLDALGIAHDENGTIEELPSAPEKAKLSAAIEGLYATGNTTASVMGRTYPGAGASIAASFTFAWIAAYHAFGQAAKIEAILAGQPGGRSA